MNKGDRSIQRQRGWRQGTRASVAFTALTRLAGASALLMWPLQASTAHAGSGSLAATGESSLTYTYELPPGGSLTSTEVTSISAALRDASIKLCQATDGLVRVTDWNVDPAAKKTDADVTAYPRKAGRANAPGAVGTPGAGISMFSNDFDDGSTIAHELGH